MSGKQVKKLKRVFKRSKQKMVNQIMDDLCDCGFWLRLSIAWGVIKGK